MYVKYCTAVECKHIDVQSRWPTQQCNLKITSPLGCQLLVQLLVSFRHWQQVWQRYPWNNMIPFKKYPVGWIINYAFSIHREAIHTAVEWMYTHTISYHVTHPMGAYYRIICLSVCPSHMSPYIQNRVSNYLMALQHR